LTTNEKRNFLLKKQTRTSYSHPTYNFSKLSSEHWPITIYVKDSLSRP